MLHEFIGKQREYIEEAELLFLISVGFPLHFPASNPCSYNCFSSSMKRSHTEYLQKAVGLTVLLDCFNKKGNILKFKICEKILTARTLEISIFSGNFQRITVCNV